MRNKDSDNIQDNVLQPCESEKNNDTTINSDKRKRNGKLRSRKNREELKRILAKMENTLAKMNLSAKMAPKKKQSPKRETPRTKVRKLLQGQKVSPEFRRKLLFGEVLTGNLKGTSKKLNVTNRRKLITNLSSAILRKYKCLSHMHKFTSRRLMAQRKDESSHICAGKKETVTMKKSKKQCTLLNYTTEKLHKRFTAELPEMKLGYSTFCKHSPFWVLSPIAADRNNCIIHENIDDYSKRERKNLHEDRKSLNSVAKYMRHVANIRHKYQALDSVKKEMKENVILVHCEFLVKLQLQVCGRNTVGTFWWLQTSSEPSHCGCVPCVPSVFSYKTILYCTLSDILQHYPVTICIHLTPVIEDVRTVMPGLKTVHFLSDGPTNQYQNRKMFYLMGSFLREKLEADCIQWYYSEAGHGKGARACGRFPEEDSR
ncbi:hypothetical protein PR048_013246 [Dryococelus australis]|uniref:Uncharacterized protein n=1 Tax=Dryococelus australis TaxID=614101 RepID=A0ABQ9HSH2_9NEOP|nr:hypothetical protein PR048_013246 [Dryococelus australis]